MINYLTVITLVTIFFIIFATVIIWKRHYDNIENFAILTAFDVKTLLTAKNLSDQQLANSLLAAASTDITSKKAAVDIATENLSKATAAYNDSQSQVGIIQQAVDDQTLIGLMKTVSAPTIPVGSSANTSLASAPVDPKVTTPPTVTPSPNVIPPTTATQPPTVTPPTKVTPPPTVTPTTPLKVIPPTTVNQSPTVIPPTTATQPPTVTPPTVTPLTKVTPPTVTPPTVTPPTTPFSPKLVTGLQVWLDANDPNNTGSAGINNATIASWKDKSGNLRNMVFGGDPVKYANSSVNSLNSISLNGSNSGNISVPVGSFPSNYCCFIVAILTSGNNLSFFGRSDAEGWPLPYDSVGSTRNVGVSVGSRRLVGTGIDLSTVGSKPFLWNFALTNYSSTGNTGAYSEYLNGINIQLKGGQTTGLNAADADSNIYFVGRGGSQLLISGNFCEILIYSSNLSNTDRQKIEGYLAWKWGLNTELPTSHPYKSVNPLISSLPSVSPSVSPSSAAPTSSVNTNTGLTKVDAAKDAADAKAAAAAAEAKEAAAAKAKAAAETNAAAAAEAKAKAAAEAKEAAATKAKAAAETKAAAAAAKAKAAVEAKEAAAAKAKAAAEAKAAAAAAKIVTSVTLDKTTLSINVKTTGTITATVGPSTAPQTTIGISSDKKIATIAGPKSGVFTVTGIKAGTATITITGGKIKATCVVTVG